MLFTQDQLVALVQVLIIDIVLAGDNAVVVGLAAASVPQELRARVIFWGIAAAVVMRIGFAVVATNLLAIVGLTLAGGILLLWVCWKMYREFLAGDGGHGGAQALIEPKHGGAPDSAHPASFRRAVTNIVLADVSMSLDNVLAVAGAAKGDTGVLVIGLVLAVAFMGLAASFIARLLERYPWITWVGLAVILFVALEMIWQGSHQVGCRAGWTMFCEQGGALKALMGLWR